MAGLVPAIHEAELQRRHGSSGQARGWRWL